MWKEKVFQCSTYGLIFNRRRQTQGYRCCRTYYRADVWWHWTRKTRRESYVVKLFVFAGCAIEGDHLEVVEQLGVKRLLPGCLTPTCSMGFSCPKRTKLQFSSNACAFLVLYCHRVSKFVFKGRRLELILSQFLTFCRGIADIFFWWPANCYVRELGSHPSKFYSILQKAAGVTPYNVFDTRMWDSFCRFPDSCC